MYISKEKRAILKETFALKTNTDNKETLNEGSWALPFDLKSASKLKKFMASPKSKEEALDILYYIFGDDELFDNISDPVDPEDVRFEVRTRLKEIIKGNEEKIDPETKEILNSIINTFLTEADDPIKGDGQVPVEDDNITVEVDGEVVTDTTEEEIPNDGSQNDALDGYGSKLAITDMLLQAVNDENTTIQYYNNLIAACNQEGFTDIANIIKHINEEENIHVGMLQHAMSTISEQAKNIKDGEEEAVQIINGEGEGAEETVAEEDAPIENIEEA